MVNANINLFLITYMATKRENKDSWTSFLYYLHEAIGLGRDDLPFSFMNDR